MKFIMLKKSPDQRPIGKHYGPINKDTGKRTVFHPGDQIESSVDLAAKYPDKFQRLELAPQAEKQEKKGNNKK